tara:strand:- start:1096 stop:1473 length:378 start_codon:yes stop_codon:yes gene_type:complete
MKYYNKYIKLIAFVFLCLISTKSYSSNINEDLTIKISKNIRCLICQGQSVYDSQSDFAVSMKLVIKKKLDSGLSEKEIYEYLINKYGQWITYKPKFSKNTYFLWLLPVFIFIFGGWLILRRVKIL